MSESNNVVMTNEQLQALLAGRTPAPAGTAAMMPAAHFSPVSFAPPMMPAAALAAPQPTGLALKLTLVLPDGMECPVDVQLGPEHWNPMQLPQLIQGLIAQGWPIKTYRPRQQFSGGGGYGGGNGGGWRGGGGGNFRGGGGYGGNGGGGWRGNNGGGWGR